MKYTSISDCWKAIEKCTTVDEVNILFESFPEDLGEWEVDKSILADRLYVVSVDYYDKAAKEYKHEYRHLEFINEEIPADLTLYTDDLEYSEEDDEVIYIPKHLFRGFDENSYIKIRIEDAADRDIYLYQYVGEDSYTVGLRKIIEI